MQFILVGSRETYWTINELAELFDRDLFDYFRIGDQKHWLHTQVVTIRDNKKTYIRKHIVILCEGGEGWGTEGK